MSSQHPDPRAVEVARKLGQATDCDYVILFGSRARSDWTGKSDVDLMVLCDDTPSQDTILETQETASRIAEAVFEKHISVDVLFMTHREFKRMSEHTINHVASRARREGTIVPRDPESYGSKYNEEYEQNEQLEFKERQRSIGDANTHYRNMHVLLDAGIEDKATAFMAQQTIENAMKALISTLGEEYNPHHETRAFANDIRRLDKTRDWRFASNLGQLDNFAGGNRYGPAISPIQDFREMANNVTEDLDLIYEKIRERTGEDPWEVPPKAPGRERNRAGGENPDRRASRERKEADTTRQGHPSGRCQDTPSPGIDRGRRENGKFNGGENSHNRREPDPLGCRPDNRPHAQETKRRANRNTHKKDKVSGQAQWE